LDLIKNYFPKFYFKRNDYVLISEFEFYPRLTDLAAVYCDMDRTNCQRTRLRRWERSVERRKGEIRN